MRDHSHWRRIVAGAALLLAAHASLGQDDNLEKLKVGYKRPASIPFPAQNPYTPEKAALGKMLFFDPRLSRDQNLNCASCHNPSFGWEVPFAKAIGAAGAPLRRQSPTVLNRAWASHFFWDGRASSLEEQAKGPIESKAEMDIKLGDVVKRLSGVSGYRKAFNTAFPGEGITENTILKALGTYERTLVSGTTPFDRWIEGDESAISASAKRGFAVFNGKARCSVCHSGWNFTDDKFYDIGARDESDKGRFEVTGKPEDLYAMKTPTLREVAHRSPYGHDGSLTTLDVVVQHYVDGGVARPSRSPLIQPLALTAQDIKDLVEFMSALSSDSAVIAMPNLPVLQ
jgi:cytochrome c peroxidase